MDYDAIAELLAEIKLRYVETGCWDGALCQRLVSLTGQIPLYICRRRGVAEDDQGDIVQQVYEEVFKHIHKIQDNRSFPRYIYVITQNLCKRYWRKRYGRPEESMTTEDAAVMDIKAEPGPDSIDKMLVREDLRKALDKLPDIYKNVITLYYFAGYNGKEIAVRQNTSINTIMCRLRRGRNMLKKLMEESNHGHRKSTRM